MIEDCFKKWYYNKYPDINPEMDDFYQELLECYKAGWKRSLEVEEALTELTQIAEELGEYDDLSLTPIPVGGRNGPRPGY